MSEQPSLRERLLATREVHRHSWGQASDTRIASGCTCGAEAEFDTVAGKDAWDAEHEVDAFLAAVSAHITEGLKGFSGNDPRLAAMYCRLLGLLPSPEQEQSG